MTAVSCAGAVGSSGRRPDRSGGEHQLRDRSPPSVTHPAARSVLGGQSGGPTVIVEDSNDAVRALLCGDAPVTERAVLGAF